MKKPLISGMLMSGFVMSNDWLFGVVFGNRKFRMFVEIDDFIRRNAYDRMSGKVIGVSGNRTLLAVVQRDPRTKESVLDMGEYRNADRRV